MENARCTSGVGHFPGSEARVAGGGAEEVTEGHPRGAQTVRAVHKQAAAPQDVATATASASGMFRGGFPRIPLSFLRRLVFWDISAVFSDSLEEPALDFKI